MRCFFCESWFNVHMPETIIELESDIQRVSETWLLIRSVMPLQFKKKLTLISIRKCLTASNKNKFNAKYNRRHCAGMLCFGMTWSICLGTPFCCGVITGL